VQETRSGHVPAWPERPRSLRDHFDSRTEQKHGQECIRE
jgi:hypothetical protein